MELVGSVDGSDWADVVDGIPSAVSSSGVDAEDIKDSEGVGIKELWDVSVFVESAGSRAVTFKKRGTFRYLSKISISETG